MTEERAKVNYENSETRGMTEAYHRSRRNLVVLSGVLLAWEYVGLSLGNPNNTSRNQAPASGDIFGFSVALENPSVIPSTLAIVILYLIFRLLIEFHHHDQKTRDRMPARFDLTISLSIASISLAFYILQGITGANFADIFSTENMTSGFAGVFIIGVFEHFLIRMGITPKRSFIFDFMSIWICACGIFLTGLTLSGALAVQNSLSSLIENKLSLIDFVLFVGGGFAGHRIARTLQKVWPISPWDF